MKNIASEVMIKAVPSVKVFQTVEDAERMLLQKAKKFITIDYIYVLDEKNRLVGVVSIKDIFKASRKEKIANIMKIKLVFAHLHTHQERIVYLALKHEIKAIPIVDKENHFLGVVQYDDILKIFNKETQEDLLKFAGIHAKKEFDIIRASTKEIVKARMPWLLLGLLGGIAAASIVGFFEKILSSYIILALFIPVLVYMSDAIGTQSETLIVRSIALDPKLSLAAYLKREFFSAAILSLVCGIFLLVASAIGWCSLRISIIVGLSLFFGMFAGVFVSTILPLFLKKLNLDPAIAAGPFATIISDISTIIIYFGIASLMLAI